MAFNHPFSGASIILSKRLLLALFAALFVCLSIKSQVNHWETVVYDTDTWRYLVPNSAVNPEWINLNFNDADWLEGQGGFGYGDDDDNTEINNTVSCYQRISFNISDLSEIESFILIVDYDDAFGAYLNGIEIARANIVTTGQPSFNSTANGNHEAVLYQGGTPENYQFDASILTEGENVLCVQVHNVQQNSSDLTCRTFLSLGINNTSENYGPTPSWFEAPFVFESSNLPIVIIETENGAPIPDDPKINGFIGVIYNGEGERNYLSDSFNEHSGPIGISKRGSSSQMFPKKQWAFETRDNQGAPYDVTMFNMAWDNDWVLYAPYSDKSLIRNVLAYQMGWDLGVYAPRTKLVEVVLNGSYEGVYVLTEKIKRKDGKVGSNDVEIEENEGNDITGDYILKLDKTTSGGVVAWYSPVPPYAGANQAVGFQYHDPKFDELSVFQKNYIQDYITNFENALNGPNFLDPNLGYKPYIDINSFIAFFLVNEISKNVDGYRISSFLHKLRTSEGGLIHAGPLWDFNLAFGNADYCQGAYVSNWQMDFYQWCGGKVPFWWNKLTQDPAYTNDLHCKWLEMRQGVWHTDSLMQRIDSLALYLNEAQQRNFQRWDILNNYVWPNQYIGGSFSAEINYLKNWITTRITWMDNNMPGSCSDLGNTHLEQGIIKVYPNPCIGDINISFGTHINDGSLRLVNLHGQCVYEDKKLYGAGLKIHLNNLSPGLYNCQMIIDGKFYNKKIMVE